MTEKGVGQAGASGRVAARAGCCPLSARPGPPSSGTSRWAQGPSARARAGGRPSSERPPPCGRAWGGVAGRTQRKASRSPRRPALARLLAHVRPPRHVAPHGAPPVAFPKTRSLVSFSSRPGHLRKPECSSSRAEETTTAIRQGAGSGRRPSTRALAPRPPRDDAVTYRRSRTGSPRNIR